MACAAGSLPSCLICGKNLDEQKPLTSDHVDQWSQFKSSFHCFCRLLNVNDGGDVMEEILEGARKAMRGGGGVSPWGTLLEESPVEQEAFGLPCCGECCGALNEMERLEQTISELKASQMGHVEGLKGSLLMLDDDHLYNDNTWGQIRKQIVACILKRGPSLSRPQPRPSKHPPPTPLLSSSRTIPNILKRKSSRKPSHVGGSDFGQLLTTTPLSPKPLPVTDECILPNDMDAFVGEAFCDDDFVFDDDVPIASPPSPGGGNKTARNKKQPRRLGPKSLTMEGAAKLIRPCHVVVERLSPATLSKFKPLLEYHSSEDPPKKSDLITTSKKPKLSTSTSKQSALAPPPLASLVAAWSSSSGAPKKLANPCPGPVGHGGRLFYQVNDATLIYKYTLVNVSHGCLQFSCMEPGCSAVFEDPATANWTPLFDKMKTHIDDTHSESKNQSSSRMCPVCQEEIVGTGTVFRAHFRSKHALSMVICEICWRPVRHVAEMYKSHRWSHKSMQEKLESDERPPLKVIRSEQEKMEKWKRKMEKKRDGNYVPKRRLSPEAVHRVKQPIAPVLQLKEESPVIASSEPPQQDKKVETVSCDDNQQGLRRSGRKRCAPNWTSILEGDDETSDKDDDFVPSPAAAGGSDDEDQDFIDPQEEEDPLMTHPSSASKTKSSPSPKKKSVNPTGTRRTKANSMFYSINDHTLLYKFTPIEKSHGGTQLKCLEKDCPCIVQDLDYNSLFDKMREHVDANHQPPVAWWEVKVNPSKKVCPVSDCHAEFERAADFRGHLLSDHGYDVVICEICWKPVRNIGDMYRRHKWYHRNDQEKLEVPPPPNILVKAKLSKNGKNRWLLGRQWKPVEKPPKVPRKRVRPPRIAKVKPEKIKKAKKAAIPEGECITKNRNSHSLYFSQLSDNLLLYKYTVIKIISGGLSCQEPDCSAFLAKGTDYSAFEEMKEHVKTNHLKEGGNNIYTSRPRECPLCPEGTYFRSGFSFRQHMLYKEPHAPRPYICQICWKPLRQAATIEHHMRTHMSLEERGDLKDKPKVSEAIDETAPVIPEKIQTTGTFICEECGRVFSKSYLLRYHMARHVPKSLRKLWSCDQCPDKLLSRNALRNHIERKHMAPELKRYKYCPICNQKFYFRDTHKFTVHMRTHRNERPFVCDICGVGFAASAPFKMHQARVHTDERKFQCEYCEMNYKHPRNLVRHQESAHKDRVTPPDPEQRHKWVPYEYRPEFIGPKIAFPCEFCDKIFQLRSRMTKHVKMYHANTKNE